MVYSSCAYEAEHDPTRESSPAVPPEKYIDPERANINYEIAVVDIDGKNSRRLTENLIFENFRSGRRMARESRFWRGSIIHEQA